MTYAFVPGSTFSGDADEVQAELDRLRRTGGLTPEAVVTAARSKRSVLHPHIFDGTTEQEALEKYHLHRAHSLIKAIVIVRDEAPTSIRANIRVTSDAGRTWESVELPEARLVEQMRLKRELRSIRSRLHDLEMFPNIVLAIDEVLAA